jgi:iron-sulfur cluster protein
MAADTEYKKNVAAAIANPKLSKALHLFGDAYLIARENAFRGLDFEAMRSELAVIKDDVRIRRKELLAEFIRNAEAAGSKVFVAKDTKEANDYVIRLAKEKGAKLIAKSKSMVSEEAHFNKALATHGIRAAETDLGEWIVQLAGQRPSHMVMPAIHMFKEEVAELFSKEAGKTVAPEIKALVDHARKRLRREYFDADIGLTGANFLIAETGGIGLITNEGNARLCATLPKVHVVFAGIHKLVPGIEEAIKITRLLPRNATGQLLTSYVTWIRGAVPTAGETKEQHIVLIDGGREALYESTACRDALRCIQCGACANVCPVFQTVGGHVFGSIYISAIGIILTAFYEGLEQAKEITRACIGCRSCVAVCPAKIDLEEIILHLRNEVTRQYGMGVVKNVAFKAVMKNRGLFHSMVRAAAKLQAPVTRKHQEEERQVIRHLPLHFMAKDLTEWRDLPAIAPRPFRDIFATVPQNVANPSYRVGFFVGCGADFVYPEVGVSLIKVLNHLGVSVVFPPKQSCCGIPALYSGDTETGVYLAQQSVEAFSEANVDYILAICPTCTMAIKRDFVERLADQPLWSAKAVALAAKTMDASAFLENVLGASATLPAATGATAVTYHDSCHLKRGSNVWKEPRALLRRVGYRIEEMKNSDRCCGFGGTYSFLSHPQISRQITADKVATIQATGAKTVATDCPGCMIMLKGAVGKADQTIRCRHTMELLAEALEAPPA